VGSLPRHLMPDIGQTLREARMRRRIDMTEVEAATKIRAKYLRALENEEWDLLPGPTFVKTFLRTYADYLGLDSRVLVEEYRQRYERPSTMDLTPFAAGLGGRSRRRPRLASIGPGLVVVLGVALLLGALYLLGTLGEEDGDAGPNQVQEPAPTPRRGGEQGGSDRRDRNQEREPRPRRVRVRLEATGAVYVCLVDARGRQVVDEETLQAGDRTRTFTSRRFRSNFGNGNLRMRVNGRTYPVAASADPIGYELRPGRRPRRLPDGQRPDCSA
jgi:cytoskeleton protein RodZ